MPPDLPLPLVDGHSLPDVLRAALRPGETLVDEQGRRRRLPRWFYEVPTRRRAEELELAPGFHLHEFLHADVREAAAAQAYPRYVPCAVTLLAAALAVLRQRLGTTVRIAANGGYRTPAHALTRHASTHCWATAANVFRVGDDYLDDEAAIERVAAVVRSVLPGAWIRPFGYGRGFADDHLHLDLGYVLLEPREASGETDDEHG